jgi:transcription factor 1
MLSKSISSTATPNKDLTDAEAKQMLKSVSSSKPISMPTIAPTSATELPPIEHWKKTFKFSEKRKRKTLCNAETAKKLAELFVPEGSKDKIIVEAYAG